MKIYNTLTRKKEEFIPLEEGKVRMYVCGPTVYNYIHIGNARPMIIFDTVRRYLEYKGYDVNYVSNFTDIDDKIIKRANEEGVDAIVISEKYIKEAERDMKNLNVKEATSHPKATEEINSIVNAIQVLIVKGYAYEVAGTVYFKTRSFKEYGKLSKKNIDDLQAGHREMAFAGEEEKKDSLDFVLWKPKKEGEPSWNSPWGEGRPGWHIECSVMSKNYLGDQIDIHAGGEDLIFPHHENEIAQSESLSGETFAKYWMHNGFLNIDNVKMSKSLGNFFTVREVEEKYDLQILRFFMLNAHYRSPLNFSADLMESSKNALERILTAVDRLKEIGGQDRMVSSEEEVQLGLLKELIKKFEDAMEDDFNTADAIAAIFEIVKLSNIQVTTSSSLEFVEKILSTIVSFCDIIGIKTERQKELLDDDIEVLIEERQTARKEKDFKRADEIRNLLLEKDIILEDTREGVKWKRA